MKKNILLILTIPLLIIIIFAQTEDFAVAVNLNQIEYSLTVVDLTEEKNLDKNLEQLSLNTEETGEVEFIYAEPEIGMSSAEIVSNLALSAEKTEQKAISIANPTLVTEIGTAGYINLSEEILNWEEEELETQEIDFSTELTPLNLTSKGEIESEVSFSVNSGTDFSTTVRLEAGETKLIGFIKVKENNFTDRLRGKSKRTRERTYAIYLSSNIAGVGPAARLDGLDNLLFQSPEPAFKLNNQYLQILFAEDYSPDLDYQYQAESKKNILNFKSRDGFSYLEFGLGFPVADGLFIDSKAVVENHNFRGLLGFDDKIQFNENLCLTAGLYPLVFSIAETEFKDYAAYAELSYLPGTLVFNLSYFHNLENEPLRLETGFKLKNFPYFMVAVTGDSDGVESWLGGLRFQF